MASPAHLADAVGAEASSLWARAVGAVTGQRPANDYGASMENGRVTPTPPRESHANTASAQFAHTSSEVRPDSHYFPQLVYLSRLRIP